MSPFVEAHRRACSMSIDIIRDLQPRGWRVTCYQPMDRDGTSVEMGSVLKKSTSQTNLIEKADYRFIHRRLGQLGPV